MEKEQVTELVKKSQNGDMEAMEQLLLYAHTPVSYQCRKMMANEQDAEDMTQEVLIAIYEKIGSLKDPSAFHKWMHTITANRCLNQLGNPHKEYQIPEDEDGNSMLDAMEDLDAQAVPDKALDNAETTRMISEVVQALPEAQRMCTLMFYFDEMSVKDIAEALAVPENTVKSRLNYARKAIKEKVLDYEKQGIKLYGVSILPFLAFFLRKAMQKGADEQAAGIMVRGIMAQGGKAAAVLLGAAPAGTTGTVAGGLITGKAIAGIAAAVLTVGLGTLALWPRQDTPAPSPVPAETTQPAQGAHIHQYEIAEEIAPACETDGSITYVCACGYGYTEILPGLEHVYLPAENGDGSLVCNLCGSVLIQEEPDCAHVWKTDYTAATCARSGSQWQECIICGYILPDSVELIPIDTTAHTWGSWLADGSTETRHCAVCGQSESRQSSQSGHVHSYTIYTIPAQNCYSSTYEEAYCEGCGDAYFVSSVPASHQYTRTVIAPAGCNFGQTVTYTCSVCGASYSTTEGDPDPNAHNFILYSHSDAYCNIQSMDQYYCGYCGQSRLDSYGPFDPNRHFNIVSSGISPSCESDGETREYCFACGFTTSLTIIPATGHTITDTVVPPTQTDEGYTLHTCANCSYRSIDTPVPPLG